RPAQARSRPREPAPTGEESRGEDGRGAWAKCRGSEQGLTYLSASGSPKRVGGGSRIGDRFPPSRGGTPASPTGGRPDEPPAKRRTGPAPVREPAPSRGRGDSPGGRARGPDPRSRKAPLRSSHWSGRPNNHFGPAS